MHFLSGSFKNFSRDFILQGGVRKIVLSSWHQLLASDRARDFLKEETGLDF